MIDKAKKLKIAMDISSINTNIGRVQGVVNAVNVRFIKSIDAATARSILNWLCTIETCIDEITEMVFDEREPIGFDANYVEERDENGQDQAL